MMAGMLFKRMAVALVLAAGWAVSAQAQIMYAGPGTVVQQRFWNPQVYGYNTYPYIAPGPYTYGYVVPPGGVIVTPRGYMPYVPGPVPRPFAYGYPPNFYRPNIPGPYGPLQRHQGYQPGPNRPRFVNPYDPPVPQHRGADMRDSAMPLQKQDGTIVPAEHDKRTDATEQVNRPTEGPAKRPQPQDGAMPAGGSPDGPVQQGDRPAARQEPQSGTAQADPNERAN